MKLAFDCRVKHGFICQYLEDKQMTQKQLAAEIGISVQTLIRIITINYHITNYCKTTKVIEKLEKYFKLPSEFLFPEEYHILVEKKIGRRRREYKEIELVSLESIDRRQLSYEPNYNSIEVTEIVDKVLSDLPGRQEDVLRRRFGFDGHEETLQEIAKSYDLNKNTIRINEAQGIRRLQRKRTLDLLHELI